MDHSSGCSIMSISNFVQIQWQKTSLGNFFNCLSSLCSVISQDELHGGNFDWERIPKSLECGFQFRLLAMLWMAAWEFCIKFLRKIYELSRMAEESIRLNISGI